jgi:predicted NUDIX family phosphoesterase
LPLSRYEFKNTPLEMAGCFFSPCNSTCSIRVRHREQRRTVVKLVPPEAESFSANWPFRFCLVRTSLNPETSSTSFLERPPLSTAPTTSLEQVLVVPTALFHELGQFQGFRAEGVDRYLKTLLDPAYTSYRPRVEVEEDPGFKQLIPYCVLRFGDEIFHYTRGKVGGDGRLRSKRSIGIGGHISSEDSERSADVYREGMRRELEEEVHIDTRWTERCVGLINDDETEVGRVHLGVVHIFDLEAPQVRPREQSIMESGFAKPSELARELDQFETWTQICLNYLISADR